MIILSRATDIYLFINLLYKTFLKEYIKCQKYSDNSISHTAWPQNNIIDVPSEIGEILSF